MNDKQGFLTGQRHVKNPTGHWQSQDFAPKANNLLTAPHRLCNKPATFMPNPSSRRLAGLIPRCH
nr:hypothetical protein [Comamonas testosteroni]